MLDLTGLQISPEERDILTHPIVGGVILFSRNYESPEQVARKKTATANALKSLIDRSNSASVQQS